MKKLLLSCLITLSCVPGFSQKEQGKKPDDEAYIKRPILVVGSKEYDEAKAKGLLAHYEFKMVEGKLLPVPEHTYQKTGTGNSTTSSTLTPCDVPPIQGVQYWAGNPADDATTPLIPLPFTFCFYGNNYTQVRQSTNGNIQFPPTNNAGFTSTGFPTPTDQMIAPFWADVDIRGGGNIYYDIYPTYAVFSWDSVGYFNSHGNLRNTFQCVITDGLDPILPPGKNVGFYFGEMNWTTGDASGGTGGFPNVQPGSPAMVGANAGNNVDYFVVGRFGVPGAAYDGPMGNSDGVSWLNHKKFFFNICPPVGGNQEPISVLVGYCDTMKVCGNDTLYVKNTWIAPEVTQSVTITASAPTLGSSFSYMTLPSFNGTDIYMIIDGSTATPGYHQISMTATDNGTPPMSSVLNYVVYVDAVSSNLLNGHIVLTPTLGACPGGTVAASVVLNGTPDGYLWSNNSSTPTTTFTTIFPSDSTVFVTVTSGICSKTLVDHININPVPVAAISGDLNLCTIISPTTVLTATNTLNPATQGPHTYQWTGTGSISDPSSATPTVNQGVYTVTVTNQYGCVSVAQTTVNIFETPNYTVSTNAISGGSVYCASQDTARISLDYLVSTPTSCGPTSFGCSTPTQIQVGTGTNSNCSTCSPSPYGNFYKNERQQYLFTAAELTAAGMIPGKISSLTFTVNSILPLNTTHTSNSSTYIGTLPQYSIKLKCTNATVLTSSFDNNNLTQVYLNDYTPVVGANTHVFNQGAYVWDGTSSLLVDVCYTPTVALANTYYTSNPQVPYTSVGANRSLYYNSDVSPACGTTQNGTLSQNRPNMTFGNCLAQQVASQFDVTVTPTVGVVIPAGKDSIKIDLPNTQSTTCYTVTVTNPVGGCHKDTVICVNTQIGVTNANFTASSYSVCAGTPVTLTAMGADTYTLYYIQNGTPVFITNSYTATVTPPAQGVNVYSLVATGFCGAPPASYTLGITVLPQANLIIAPLVDVTKCAYSTVWLHAGVGSNTSANSGAPYSYQWFVLPGSNPVSTTDTYGANSNSTQTIVVTVTGFCANPDADTVVVSNFPDNLVAQILDSASVCSQAPFTLTSGVSGGRMPYTYSWTMNNNVISSSPNVTTNSPTNQGYYPVTLTVTDSCGFTRTDVQVIEVQPPCSVTIPNVITPNGDGVNDMFAIQNLDKHPNSSLTIFDRWGRKVYESSNYQNDWKADGLSDGTFFYSIDVTDDKVHTGYISVFHSK